MATGDQFNAGKKQTSVGEVYVKFDPSTLAQRPDNYLRVAMDPSSLFYDTFDTSLDTTNRWTTSGTVAPTSSNGTMTISPATTALQTSIITSQPTFQLLGNMYNQVVAVITTDSTVKTGNYRFFGLGVAAGSPTVAAPITNGVGFEWSSADGLLYGVVYSGGVRTQSVALSSYQPLDTSPHRFNMYFKTSKVYFEIDNVSDGSIAYPNPNVSNLPTLLMSVNGAATVSPAATFTTSFVGVGDTSSNSNSQGDGTFPWRKQRIDTYGAAIVSSDGSKPTYEYGVAAFAPVATPTTFLVIAGSATKTVRIKKIRVSGVATAQGNMQIQMQRWSTAGTLGSAVLTALTAVKHDTTDPAATAVVSTVGTANYTTQGTGTAVPFLCDRIGLATVATGAIVPNVFEFSTRSDKALVLRGTTDIIAVSGNGSAIPAGGVFDISVETEEDNT